MTKMLLEKHLGKVVHIVLHSNDVMIGRLEVKKNFDNTVTCKPRLYIVTMKDGSRCEFRSADVKKCQEVKRSDN